MAIRFETADGQIGTLDVATLARDELGGTIVGVEEGIVRIKIEDGSIKAFSLSHWAEQYQASIVFMEGFNNPDTAIDQPPNGMNYFDQSVFFHDGMDMNALQEMFPKCLKNDDGSVVVLDNDGLWKVMWSPYLATPNPPLSFNEEVAQNLSNDPRLTLRTAGITFLYGLAGEDVPKSGKLGGVPVPSLVKVLSIIGRNAPYENKFQIGKIINQTTGIDPWKLHNAFLAPEDTGIWINKAITLSSFQFRMAQMQLAEMIVDGMRSMAQKDFETFTDPLAKLSETSNLMVNLKQVFAEFIQFLVGLDLLRDISRTTGLSEWVSLNEDSAFDKSKLPEMPAFVAKFVTLLRWIMPIVQKPALSFAKGQKGFKSIMALMTMIDDCIYSLAGVPDSSAKYKMFMALKKAQAQLENKLAFHYHPDPLKNKDGLKENPFMQAKALYSDKREQIYKLCQTPKEAWNNTMLESLRQASNIERFYDTLPAKFANVMKSFCAMDAAYDMQPWVDVNHSERTHDPFSEHNESFGMRPPEAGALAKNSPRAVFNIGETLVEGAAFLSSAPMEQTRELLRNPWLMATLIKQLMTASVNREIGTVEILNKFGGNDMMASPDPSRIWEDPEMVAGEQRKQIEEMMGQIAMEQAQQNQMAQAQGQAAQAQEEQLRSGQQPQKAGAGPNGPAQQAVPARSA